MAALVWPPELPQRVLRENYRETLADGRLFSSMDGGPPKRRRRFTSAPGKVEAKILVEADRFARFKRFWTEETRGGILPFALADQIFDGAPVLTASGAPLLTADGAPVLSAAIWLVCFDKQPPVVTPWGALFEVSFALVILP